MTKLITGNFRLHLDSTVTSLATIWRIVRKDGQKFYFTDHDVDVTYDGNVYSSRTGYTRSAISNSADLTVDNLDIEGVFDSLEITKQDLRSGLFDFAEVYVSLINWQDPDGDGSMKLRRGWFGEVELTQQGTYRTELRGLAQVLSQNILDHYQANCRVDLGSVKCGVPIDPPTIRRGENIPLTDPDTGNDVYRKVATSSPPAGRFGALTNISNAGFESGDLTGWSVGSGSWAAVTTADGETPQAGTYFLDLVTGSGTISQDIELRTSLGGDLPDADLAEGLVILYLTVHVGSSTPDSTHHHTITLEALDSTGAVIEIVETTGDEFLTVWTARNVGGILPEGTAKVRLTLAGGILEEVHFDSITGNFENTAVTMLQSVFENRIYKVTVAGIAADTEPTYDTVVGNLTVDGGVTLEAVEAWTRDAVVDVVTDNRNFTITVIESRDVDDWFRYGAIRWITGNNAGKISEVKKWTQTGAAIEMYLAQPLVVLNGDAFAIYPGCNKSLDLAGGCDLKFGNALNFRGDPFIPGEDDALGYPVARSGGGGGGTSGGDQEAQIQL